MQKFTPIGNVDLNKKIHIYGAGVSGLLMGYFLKKSNKDFIIFESSNITGGKIQTDITEFGPVEKAANAIYASETIFKILNELKLEYQLPTPNLKKLIFRFNKPQSIPLTFFEFFKFFFKSLKKIKLDKDFERYTVKEFFMPFFGEKFIDQVMSAAFRGIYSVEADVLNMASLYPKPLPNQNYFQYFKMALKERRATYKNKPISISFKNGMAEFITALSTYLKDHIKTNSTTELLDNSIICTDADSAKKLISDQRFDLLLSQIKYTKVQTSTLFTENKISFLENSFGILFPANGPVNIMGILANSNIFKHRTNNINLSSYTIISPVGIKSENELLKLNLNLNIKKQYFTSWEKAIPIYDTDRYNSVQKLKELIKEKKNLMLFGNYTNGISIREMAEFCKIYSANNVH